MDDQGKQQPGESGIGWVDRTWGKYRVGGCGPAPIDSVIGASNNDVVPVGAASESWWLVTDLLPDNDTPGIAPLDRVIGDLAAGRVLQPDRARLGKALDKANADASGTRAGANEAFGRITGRVPSGLATLTGRSGL